MPDISGFPYFPVEFDKEGRAFDPGQVKALGDHLARGETTDLIAISHGWNNDMAEARELYEEFFRNARALVDAGRVPGVAGRKFAVLGVFWPSKKFADKELIASGAAGAQSSVELDDLREKLRNLRGTFDAPGADQKLAELEALLPKLEDSDSACRSFLDGLRSLVPSAGARDNADSSTDFFGLAAGDLLEKLKQPVSFTTVSAGATGGAAAIGDVTDGAAGLGSFFSGLVSGMRNALNFTTYYQMKARAGLVGTRGLNPLLASTRQKHAALRMHLVGHSFGGRLVAATAAGADDASMLQVSSLSLLQAAFSHYAFSKQWNGVEDGAFRRVITRQAVSGPIIATCTANDKAVGLAYPIASLVAGQIAAGLGDENDKYGGIGRNGAQKTPEAVKAEVLEVGERYQLQAGKVNNLHTDRYITSHGDVANPRVAYAVLTTIGAT